MTGWRETCDEIEEAGKKATARPWYETDGLAWKGLIRADDNEPPLFQVGFHNESADADVEYLTPAANNADRLARMTQKLIDSLWKFSMCSIAIEHGDCAECREAFEKYIDRLWKESAK